MLSARTIYGGRRTISLRMPARRNALGCPVPAQPSHA
jgi:hypothetical protein